MDHDAEKIFVYKVFIKKIYQSPKAKKFTPGSSILKVSFALSIEKQ